MNLNPIGKIAFPLTVSAAVFVLSAMLLPVRVISADPTGSGNATTVSGDYEIVNETPPVVTERARISRTWSWTVILRHRRTGKVVTERRSYVEVASGLNFRRGAGQWQESREEFDRAGKGGFAAKRGLHQLSLGANLDALPAIELTTEDDLVLQSAPIALGYFDPVSGQHVMLAQVKESAPRQTAPNEVIYPDALDNLAAAFRYTYRRGGMSQDLVLLEAPPAPATFGFSAETRLELYTEWAADTPEPVRTPQPIRIETDPVVRASKVEPDFLDEMLQFGADTRLVRGRAYALERAEDTVAAIPVGKQFVKIDGRPVLIESAEFRALQPLFNGLQQAAVPRGAKGRIGSTREEALAYARTAPAEKGGQTRVALAQLPGRSVVIDYETVSGTIDRFTFANTITYYVAAPFDVTSVATIEQGSFLKFALNANVRILGSIVCPTVGQTPAIMTSRDDDLFGERLTGISTGKPTYMASPAIAPYYTLSPAIIQNVRIRWAKDGISAAGSTALTHTIQNSVFEQTQTGIRNQMSAGSINLLADGNGVSTVKQCGVTAERAGTGTTTGNMEINCGVVNASRTSGNQGEPAIAVRQNPINSSLFQIVIVAMNTPDNIGLLKMVSDDSGASWTTSVIADGSGGMPTADVDGDPSLTFDDFGNLFLAYRSVSSGIQFFYATDAHSPFTIVPGFSNGGATLATPKVGTGPSGVAGVPGSVWVTLDKGTDGLFAAGTGVTGLGTFSDTWATTPTPLPNSFGLLGTLFSSVAIGPNGEVLVLHIVGSGATRKEAPVTYFTSLNSDGLNAANFVPKPSFSNNLGWELIAAMGDVTPVIPIPVLAWDRMRNKIYVSYPDKTMLTGESDDDVDVYVRYSINGASSWSDRIKINDDSTNTSQFHPTLAVDESSGNVSVAWYDCRGDVPENRRVLFYAAVSRDAFATSEPSNFQLNPLLSDALLPMFGGGSFKEYVGISYFNGWVFPAWIDNSNSTSDNPDGTGKFDVYVGRIPY